MKDPENIQYQKDLAVGHGNVGRAALRELAFESAAKSFEEGVKLLAKLEEEGKIHKESDRDILLRQRRSLILCKNGAAVLENMRIDLDKKLAREQADELMSFRAAHLAQRQAHGGA